MKEESDYGILMGHYFLFLGQINRSMVTFGSALLAMWNKTSLKKADNMSKGMLIVGALINMLYPLLIWLCIKFHFHLVLELCFVVVANFIEPISYFYNTFGSGSLVQ